MDITIESEIKEKYNNAKNRLVLLDYDGTLVNYATYPEKAELPGYIFDILFNLIDVPRTSTYIITGRRHTDIDKLLPHIPINIIAEHGAMIKVEGKWKKQLVDNASWKEPFVPILKRFTDRCPGSFVEEKIFSITWHYRNCDQMTGFECSRELLDLLRKVSLAYNVKILDGKKVVEILTNDSGKGSAVKKLFDHNSYDFILSIGDDATDEEMFEFLLHYSNAITIKVGEGATYARYKFNSINEVIKLLTLLLV